MELERYTVNERRKLKSYVATIRYLYKKLQNNPINKDRILGQIDSLYVSYYKLLYEIKEKNKIKNQKEAGYNYNFLYPLVTFIVLCIFVDFTSMHTNSKNPPSHDVPDNSQNNPTKLFKP